MHIPPDPPSLRSSAWSDLSSTRVSVAIQLISQLLPPSAENACSKRHESAETHSMTNRTKIDRPLSVS